MFQKRDHPLYAYIKTYSYIIHLATGTGNCGQSGMLTLNQ